MLPSTDAPRAFLQVRIKVESSSNVLQSPLVLNADSSVGVMKLLRVVARGTLAMLRDPEVEKVEVRMVPNVSIAEKVSLLFFEIRFSSYWRADLYRSPSDGHWSKDCPSAPSRDQGGGGAGGYGGGSRTNTGGQSGACFICGEGISACFIHFLLSLY